MISEDTLSGADGAFRVWPDATGTNAAPLLVCGQTVTNGAGGVTFLSGDDTDLYVEAVSNGTATLIYSYAGTGDAEGIPCSAALKMTAWDVDTDVDSNNDGVIDTVNSGEDGYEDYAPGLLLTVTNGLAEGAGMRYPVRHSSEFCGFTGTVRLAHSAGCGQVRVWTNTEPGAAVVSLPVEWNLSLGDTPPAHVWVDGVATGVVSLAYSAIMNGQVLASDRIRLTVIPPASYAPGGGSFAVIWAPLMTENNVNTDNDVGWLDGEYLADELSSQGWPEVVWYKDETGDTDLEFGTCTVENYLNMRNAGLICVTASHGAPGYHHAVYAPYTEEGRQLIENWCSANIGMSCRSVLPTTNSPAQPGYYFARVSSAWMQSNWKPCFDTNRAITVWSICNSGTSIGQMYSVKEGAGGRWRIGYTVPTSAFDNCVVNKKFFQFMNGKQGDGLRRTAGTAWNGGDEYAGYGVTMSGNPWTTLCPAHIPANAWLPLWQFPEPGTTARKGKGWGCVLFDTYVSGNVSAVSVIQQLEGTAIAEVSWISVGVGKRGLGFGYDKAACDMIWLRTDSNKCLNEGEGGGRPLVRRVFSWPAGWQEWSF
ncbi:MAG: hypothetical protein RBU24_05345 [Kiritimatiellia bacterium]|jgi:hypothetical protein|nr:hypothetical protein [Kiritimatiellia bacterium]